MRYLCMFILVFLINHELSAQRIPTREESDNYSLHKVKSIRVISKNYSSWGTDPEKKLEYIDTLRQWFDVNGRLVKDSFTVGTHILRKLSYNSMGLLEKESWYYSPKDTYPNIYVPGSEQDYTHVFCTATYSYDSNNRLKETFFGKPFSRRTTYQYNDNGLLLAKIEVSEFGEVSSFQINTYSTDPRRKEIQKSVSSNAGVVIVEKFNYDNEGHLYLTLASNEDGKSRKTYYRNKGQLYLEEIFNKDNRIIARFEYEYNQYGLSKTISYRSPVYNSSTENKSDKLRLTEEEFYEYEVQ